MTHQLVSILFACILSRIQSQSTNVTSLIDKVCITGSLRSDVDGMYRYSYWNSTANAPVYYNTENNKYLHPYIIPNSVYRYEIDDVAGSGSAWSYSDLNINNWPNGYVFNPDDFFKGWRSYNDSNWAMDSNLRLVNCNDLCITGNDISHLDGTYNWINFSLPANSSIYYCELCWSGWSGSSSYNGAYLYGSSSSQWLIGPHPNSSKAWSHCEYSSSLISNERLDLDNCSEWRTANGSTWQIETNIAINKYKCPSIVPTSSPTTSPTSISTFAPSNNPINSPSNHPTEFPSTSPSHYPTNSPSQHPTTSPSRHPTKLPSTSPSDDPTNSPSDDPTNLLSNDPTTLPSNQPSEWPSNNPTTLPTNNGTQPTSFTISRSENKEFVNDGITNSEFVIGVLIGFGCCMVTLLMVIVIWCCIYHRKKRNMLKEQAKSQISNNKKKENVGGEDRKVNMMKSPHIHSLDEHSSMDIQKEGVSDLKLEPIDSGMSDGMYDNENEDQYIDDKAYTLRTSQGE